MEYINDKEDVSCTKCGKVITPQYNCTTCNLIEQAPEVKTVEVNTDKKTAQKFTVAMDYLNKLKLSNNPKLRQSALNKIKQINNI